MLKSKAIKEFDDEKEKPRNRLQELWHKFYLSDFYSAITKPYDKIYHFCHRLKKNVRFYWNVLRFDYDFDFHCHFRMLNYKLKEVEKALINGHAIQEDKDMQALRIAIKLTKKLDADEYESRTWRKIEDRFGKLGSRTEPCNDGTGNSLWISNYGGNESEEYREKVWTVKKPMYEIAMKCQQRDERNLYAIMLKHRQSWWE